MSISISGSSSLSSYSSTSSLTDAQKQTIFAKLDTNGDGQLSPAELQAGLKKIKGHHHHGGGGGGKGAEDLASALDQSTNSDGTTIDPTTGVTSSQASSFASNLFSKLDSNGDGAVSLSEFESAVGASASAQSQSYQNLSSGFLNSVQSASASLNFGSNA